MALIILGHIGSDAGYWYVGSDGRLHHVGGWQAEKIAELRSAISILENAVQLKETGVAENITKTVMPLIERELTANMKGQAGENGIIIVGGAPAREHAMA